MNLRALILQTQCSKTKWTRCLMRLRERKPLHLAGGCPPCTQPHHLRTWTVVSLKLHSSLATSCSYLATTAVLQAQGAHCTLENGAAILGTALVRVAPLHVQCCTRTMRCWSRTFRQALLLVLIIIDQRGVQFCLKLLYLVLFIV